MAEDISLEGCNILESYGNERAIIRFEREPPLEDEGEYPSGWEVIFSRAT